MWDFGKYRHNTAVVDGSGKAYTYGWLGERAAELGACLPARSLAFCLCENSVGSLLGYVGFLSSGVVPALLSAGLDAGLRDRLIALYEVPYLWVPAREAQSFSGAEAIYELCGYRLIKTGDGRSPRLHDDLALLLATSGSTGSPKFVRQSYGNIAANTRGIVEYLRITQAERAISTLPMNYTYGLSVINTHLYAGGAMLLTDASIMQKRFWDFLRGQGATSLAGVPYTYEMLRKLRFKDMELPGLRTLTQAGGKLSPALHKEFAEYANETGRRFVVMYGQCEATARMAYLPAEDSLRKIGSMGVAMPGGRFELLDENGRAIESAGETGELVYYGENVTMGYAESADDLSLGDVRRGVLRTGDMAYRDAEGYYYINGRRKRFVKIYGNRVNLDEMEQLIKTGYPGLECACTGVDDRLTVFVTRPGLADGIARHAAAKTGLSVQAFEVRAVESIPKNDAGKTLYARLQEMLE